MNSMPIYVVLKGGLGNQLFVIASTILLGKKMARPIRFVTSWYKPSQQKFNFPENGARSIDSQEFPNIASILEKSNRFSQWCLYNIFKLSQKFDNKLIRNICLNLDMHSYQTIKKNTLLVYGYMLNSEILNNNRNEVLDLFSLPTEVEASIQKRIQKLRIKHKRIVAVHVRRGDRLEKKRIESVLSRQYFSKCLKLFNPDAYRFLFFSDDIAWCKENYKDLNIIFFDESNPIISLKAMSYCDDFILSPSTFSWWAAWMSRSPEKRVVIPKPYFQNASTVWDGLKQQNWVQVDANWETSLIN
jgi:hypothetical protein